MTKIIVFLMLFVPALINAQDIIYLTNDTKLECELDTNSIKTGQLQYKVYDMKKNYSLDTSRVFYIKDYKGELIFPKNVIGNSKSKLFHLPKSKHLMFGDTKFSTDKAALIAGYKKCPACFNDEVYSPDKFVEREFGISLNSYFRNNYELAINDSRLTLLQSTVNKIANAWPEKRSCENYLVNIYRAEEPNACAVPGGYIYISTALLDLIESEGELESILAHEIAHIEKHHALRQYYARQKKSSIVLFASLFAGTAAAISGAKNVSGVMSATSIFGELTSSIILAGYGREHEQEADIMAQIYFNKTHANNKELQNIFLKLIQYNEIRGMDNSNNGIYASHPELLNRFEQMKKAKVYTLDKPIIIWSKTNGTNNMRIEINTFYTAPSSVDTDDNEVFFLGRIKNLDYMNTMKLNKFVISSSTPSFEISMDGLDDLMIYKGAESEFLLKAALSKEDSDKIHQALMESKNFNVSISVERLKIDRKGKDAQFEFVPLTCTFSLNN